MSENSIGDLLTVLIISVFFLWLAVSGSNLETELEACKAKLGQREVRYE
jgi:hypothetical protein